MNDQDKHRLQGLASAVLLLESVANDMEVPRFSALPWEETPADFARRQCMDPVSTLRFAQFAIRQRMRGLAQGDFDFQRQRGARPGEIVKRRPG